MGLAASQARSLWLTARQSDLELQTEQLSEKRMQLAYEMDNLLNQEEQLDQLQYQQSNPVTMSEVGQSSYNVIAGIAKNLFNNLCGSLGLNGAQGDSDSDSNSNNSNNSQSQANALENKIQDEIAKLQEQDKIYELEMKRDQTQLQAVQTEEQGVLQQIQQDIQSSFSSPDSETSM